MNLLCYRRPAAPAPDWSALSGDPLLEIFTRLADDSSRLRFGAVCRSWRSAASFWRPRPWLVSTRTDPSRSPLAPTTCLSWLGPRGTLLPINPLLPEFGGLDLISSSLGWIALGVPRSYPKSVSLYNPVTKGTIALPPLTVFKKWSDVSKIVLSADPLECRDWALLAISFPTDGLAYYRAGDDGWTRLEFKAFGLCGAEFYNGNFVIAAKKRVSLCDITSVPPQIVPVDYLSKEDDEEDFEDDDIVVKESYLVNCGGKLLLFSIIANDVYASEKEDDCVDEDWENKVDVHEVHWVGDKVLLLPTDDIDGYSVFLGRNHGFVLSDEEYRSSCRNCIYLIDSRGLIRVVHLEDHKYGVIPHLDSHPESRPGWARHCWVSPRFSM